MRPRFIAVKRTRKNASQDVSSEIQRYAFFSHIQRSWATSLGPRRPPGTCRGNGALDPCSRCFGSCEGCAVSMGPAVSCPWNKSVSDRFGDDPSQGGLFPVKIDYLTHSYHQSYPIINHRSIIQTITASMMVISPSFHHRTGHLNGGNQLVTSKLNMIRNSLGVTFAPWPYVFAILQRMCDIWLQVIRHPVDFLEL